MTCAAILEINVRSIGAATGPVIAEAESHNGDPALAIDLSMPRPAARGLRQVPDLQSERVPAPAPQGAYQLEPPTRGNRLSHAAPAGAAGEANRT